MLTTLRIPLLGYRERILTCLRHRHRAVVITIMIFGRPAGLRGFRPRSETNYMRAFAVGLGVATGFYIFGPPIQEAADDVAREKAAGGGAAPGGCPQQPGGGSGQASAPTKKN